MNVWIINPFDNLPLEGYRPMRFWLMAQAFARSQAKVTYWTGDFSHANKKRRAIVGDISNVEFDLVMLPVVPYAKNVSLKRLLSHRRLAKIFAKVASSDIESRKRECPDLIIVSSPPLELVHQAHKLAKKCGAKVIVDVMDAWPETFERVVPRFLLWPLRRLAKSNYLNASAITTVAENYTQLVRQYGYTGKVQRFYHGISLDEKTDIKSSSDSVMRDKLRMVYVGNLGRSYDLTTAIEAVGLLGGAISLDIAGKGEQEETLKAIANVVAPGRVNFHGYLSQEKMSNLLAGADIGLVPMSSDSCVGVPYKFADYAKSSLAIVSSLSGDSADLLNEFGAGQMYERGKSETLVSAILKIAPSLVKYKTASHRMAVEVLDERKIYEQYVSFACGVFCYNVSNEEYK